MFSAADQPHFTLTLEGADFQVLAFKGRETLNMPFAFELELVSERAFLDLEKLLHKQAFLQISPSGTGIHGQVYSISRGEAGRRLTRYHLSLRPHLSYLAHRVNQRIFQQMTCARSSPRCWKNTASWPMTTTSSLARPTRSASIACNTTSRT